MRKWLVVAFLAVLAGCGGSHAARMPVIVDTDLSNDDGIALLYLLESPSVDVRAVAVSGTGLVHCPAGARIALQLIALTGRTDVPVACGRSEPLAGVNAVPDDWRSAADGLFGLTLPPTTARPHGDALTLLHTAIDDAPGPPTVVELAPMTNLAGALRAHPELAKKVRRIVAMGDAIAVPGNAPGHPADETNAWIDPLAARIVARSGAALTLVPLDATNDVPVTTYFAQALKRYHYATPAATAAWELVQATGMANGSAYFWDPLAATVVVDPSLVHTVGGKTAGETIAMSADRPRFERELLSVLLGGRPFSIPPDAPDATLTFTGSRCTYTGKDRLTAGPIVLDAVNESGTPFGWTMGRLDGKHTLADLKRYVAALKGAPQAPAWFSADAGTMVPPRSRATIPLAAQLSTTGSTVFACFTQSPARVWFAAEVPVFGPG